MSKQLPIDTGWAFYRKGDLGRINTRGKNHYLQNWKSLCGMLVVEEQDKEHMHFTEKSKLFQRKICATCDHKLKLKVNWEKFKKENEI